MHDPAPKNQTVVRSPLDLQRQQDTAPPLHPPPPSVLCIRDSCEMKVLIIHVLICIYLNCRNGDQHPLFSRTALSHTFIMIK